MTRHDKSREHGNGHRDPAEIQREIQHTRGELDRTLEAIEGRFTPGELVNEIWARLRGREGDGKVKISDALSKVGTKISDNPIPLALIGIGSVALLKNIGPSSGAIKERLGESKERAGGARSRLSGAASKARDRATAARGRASSAASSAKRSISSGYGKARHHIGDNPLVLGALGFAFGAMLGAGMGGREREHERLGGGERALSDVSDVVEERSLLESGEVQTLPSESGLVTASSSVEIEEPRPTPGGERREP